MAHNRRFGLLASIAEKSLRCSQSSGNLRWYRESSQSIVSSRHVTNRITAPSHPSPPIPPPPCSLSEPLVATPVAIPLPSGAIPLHKPPPAPGPGLFAIPIPSVATPSRKPHTAPRCSGLSLSRSVGRYPAPTKIRGRKDLSIPFPLAPVRRSTGRNH